MKIQPKVARWAVPLLGPCRYKGAKGGRSGGKSHQLSELCAADMAANPNFKVAGIREVQKSIKYSLKSLLEQKLHNLGASYLFDIQDQIIKRRGYDGVAIFMGMQDHTADSVKGLEDFDRGIVDEANSLSHTSLKKLTPTFRKQGSELHFAWNPEDEKHAVDQFFERNKGHPDFKLIDVNIYDNPFVSDTALSEYHREKEYSDLARARISQARANGHEPEDKDLEIVDVFEHIWHGAYNKRSQSIVFHNWRKGVLETPENIVWFFGVDWGFSVDPNAGVKFCYISQPKGIRDIIYFRQAILQYGTRTEDLPEFLMKLEDIERWPSRADNARNETIDYCKRNGLPKMRKAKKGPGSIEDGYTFFQGVDIVIHPEDCKPLEEELKNHRYKTIKHTGEILPVPGDDWNHCLDAARYGAEGIHRKGKLLEDAEMTETPVRHTDYVSSGYESDEDWKVA